MALRPEHEQQARTLLKGILLFAGCTAEHLQALLGSLELLEVKKNKVILMDQEISKTLFILAAGSVGVWRRENNEKKLVATLHAPDFFGETSMFTESAATAQVKAEEDSRLFALPRSAFDAAAAKFPDLPDAIHKQIEIIKAARPSVIKPKREESSE